MAGGNRGAITPHARCVPQPSRWLLRQDRSRQLAENGRIAFSRGFPDQIYSIAPDGTDRTRLTHSRVDNEDPTWSGDGSQIAFVRERRPRGTKLMVMDADGSNQTSILEMRGSIRQPDWFPDGAHLLFCVEGGKVATDFYCGRRWLRSTQIGPTPSCEAAVSPDGLQVAFVRFQKNLSSRTISGS